MDKTKEEKRSSRLFLQPLTLAIVCLFLISLLLVMKVVDLKTLDRTLVDSIENRGLEIIRSVQQVADLYYERATAHSRKGDRARAIEDYSAAIAARPMRVRV